MVVVGIARVPFGPPLDESKWRVEYAAELEIVMAAAGCRNVFATLSTAADTEADRKMGSSSKVSMRGSVCLCCYVLDLATKGTYYLNCKMGQASMTAIEFKGGEQRTKVRATCDFGS